MLERRGGLRAVDLVALIDPLAEDVDLGGQVVDGGGEVELPGPLAVVRSSCQSAAPRDLLPVSFATVILYTG